MGKGTLHKVAAGYFYMLDENGKETNYYKDKGLFKNTFHYEKQPPCCFILINLAIISLLYSINMI